MYKVTWHNPKQTKNVRKRKPF